MWGAPFLVAEGCAPFFVLPSPSVLVVSSAATHEHDGEQDEREDEEEPAHLIDSHAGTCSNSASHASAHAAGSDSCSAAS